MEGGTTFFISLELDVPSQFQGIERSMKSRHWQQQRNEGWHWPAGCLLD
jgi:hypothetical protein